jgi:hypothetical protein
LRIIKYKFSLKKRKKKNKVTRGIIKKIKYITNKKRGNTWEYFNNMKIEEHTCMTYTC